jgi:hypothetical protein
VLLKEGGMYADEGSRLFGAPHGSPGGACGYEPHIGHAEAAFGGDLALILTGVQTENRWRARRARVLLARRTSAGGV